MIYFLHISKCAGTSFVALARRNVRLFIPNSNGNPLDPLRGQRLKFWRWTTEEQRFFLSSPAWGMVANEKPMRETSKFFAGVSYVTILRDPIDRLFSAWQFSRNKQAGDEPLESRGRKFASFLQAEAGLKWRRNHLISALLSPRGTEDSKRLELAKRRLDQFDHVFLMESLAEDIVAMSREGWTHLDTPWRNAGLPGHAGWSAARAALADYPALLAGLIRENQDDLELYAYARALAKRRRESPVTPAREAARAREMPPSRTFGFIVSCAYEAHLLEDEPRCAQLLEQAEIHPKARGLDIAPCRTFTEFALLRFREPKRAQREHRRHMAAKPPQKLRSQAPD